MMNVPPTDKPLGLKNIYTWSEFSAEVDKDQSAFSPSVGEKFKQNLVVQIEFSCISL